MITADKLHFARRQKLDLLVLSSDDKVQLRLQQLGHRFRLVLKRYANLSEYEPEATWFGRIPLILVSHSDEAAPLVAGRPSSFVAQLSPKTPSSAELEAAAGAGISGNLSYHDFLATVKFDFLCLLKIRAAYFPISIQDIFPMTEMTFNASIRLPLNQKFLTVLFKGFTLSEEKHRRIEEEGRLFIRIRETGDFLKYILTYNDGLGNGLRKRCRALFLCLSAQYLDLLEGLALAGGPEREERLRQSYQKIEDLCQEILGYIQNRGDVDLWEVFQEALTNEIFESWRGPWRAVFAGLISQSAGLGDPLVAMMSGLLFDVGAFEFPLEEFYSYADPKNETASMGDSVQNVSEKSWIWAGEKGLPWKEDLQPVFVPPEEKPPEFWAVAVADLVDRGSRTFMVENKVTFQYLRKTILEKIQKDPAFPAEILSSLSVLGN